MDIKPSTMTITQLLSSRCQFSIPRFWSTEEDVLVRAENMADIYYHKILERN